MKFHREVQKNLSLPKNGYRSDLAWSPMISEQNDHKKLGARQVEDCLFLTKRDVVDL